MSSQSVLVGFGLWATERTLSRFLFPIRMRIRFSIWRVLSIALRHYGTAVTGFARRVLGYIDLDLCNDLLHHICRHIWPSWRSRWSGQCLQVWHWKMQMLGTSNEMAVSSWLNLPLQLQHLYIQSTSNHSVIITAIVTISVPPLAAPTWTHCSSSWHARYPAYASRLNTDPQVCWSWWRPPVPVTIGASMVSRTAERELTRSHGTATYYDPTFQRVSRPRSTSRRWPMRAKMDAHISPPMPSKWTSMSRTFRWASITLPMATLLFVSQKETQSHTETV